MASQAVTHGLTFTQIETPLGTMLAAATADALCFLEFTDPERLERQLKRLGEPARLTSHTENDVIVQTKAELDAYFAGALREFTMRLQPSGTEFQRKVWNVLATIPYGVTRSYAEQAIAVGNALSIRAVARANGDNPIAIIIPCHRVIGSNGKLTGYGGGLWRKQWLLDHERGDALFKGVM
jgi:O-6-methylguanine DNA methyltransferase